MCSRCGGWMWRIDVEVEVEVVCFLSYQDQESGPEGSSLRLGSAQCKSPKPSAV